MTAKQARNNVKKYYSLSEDIKRIEKGITSKSKLGFSFSVYYADKKSSINEIVCHLRKKGFQVIADGLKLSIYW